MILLNHLKHKTTNKKLDAFIPVSQSLWYEIQMEYGEEAIFKDVDILLILN